MSKRLRARETEEAMPVHPRRWDFVAMNQGQARRRTFDGGYILISIQDPGEPSAEFPEPPNCRGVLRLRFDDIERQRLGLELFTREQALAILDFVRDHAASVATIACHCKAGMCRSPAVLSALAEIMGQDQDFLVDHRGRSRYSPNGFVRDTLLSEGRRHALGKAVP